MQEDGKMTRHEILPMGRKAESIYTAMEKRRMDGKKRKAASDANHSVGSFEEYMKRSTASKACYVYINGISMPVLSA